MSTTTGDQRPRAPLPSLFCFHKGRPEKAEEGEQVGGETGMHWARSQIPIQRGQLTGSTSPPIPLHLFALTSLYVRFHLKAPTTYLERQRWIGKNGPGEGASHHLSQRRRDANSCCLCKYFKAETKKNGNFEGWREGEIWREKMIHSTPLKLQMWFECTVWNNWFGDRFLTENE